MGRLFFVALMTASLETQKSNDMATNSIGLTDNRNMLAVLIATGIHGNTCVFCAACVPRRSCTAACFHSVSRLSFLFFLSSAPFAATAVRRTTLP